MNVETIILLGVATLLLRAGLTLFIGGLVRSKNAGATMLRIVCDTCFAALAFWAIGAAILQQQRNGYFMIEPKLLLGWTSSLTSVSFFYLAVLMIASGVVTAALSERSTVGSQWFASIFVAGLVIPVTMHWSFSGWLAEKDFIDIAGAASVHFAAAVCATVGVLVVGPRTGKFNRDGSSATIPGHNVPMVSTGVVLMLLGWIPFVLGCSLLRQAPLDPVAMNVILAAAAGCIAGLFYGSIRWGKPEVILAYSGLLGGLVAICGSAGTISPTSAVVIGAVAGVLVPMATMALDLRCRIDDPSGLIAVHGIGGAWGCIAAAIFGGGDLFTRTKLIAIQLLGLVCIAVFVAAISAAAFLILRATIGVRAREEDEFEGLDLAEHDINAYPDFQQTMIKSYHMREA